MVTKAARRDLEREIFAAEGLPNPVIAVDTLGIGAVVSLGLKKYARRHLSYLPISYILAKRVEYIKDTFGQAHHWKLARRAGCTSCTPCSLVSRLHA